MAICSIHYPAANGQVHGTAGGARGKHVADFGQGEAEALTEQNQRERIPICTGEDANATIALWRQQALALVEPQCAQRHTRLAGEFPNGKTTRQSRTCRDLLTVQGLIDTAAETRAVFFGHFAPHDQHESV
jgi:hypothetical protein